MIRLNVDEQALETGELLDVVKDLFWYQIFWKGSFGPDIRLKKLQKDMYSNEGKAPVFFNRNIKLATGYNLLKPLCDTATSTFIGRVPDIVTKGSDKEKERISNFSLIAKHNDFEEEISDVGLQASITGSGFLGIYADIGDEFPHYRSLDPLFTNVVYDCSIAQKRLFAYHIYWDTSSAGGISGKYVCLIYTKKKIFAYYTQQMSVPTYMAFSVYPLQLFLIDGAERSFEMEHGFNDIPIVEFLNNKEQLSDCKAVIGLISLYSQLQNNRFQNVDDIINYLLVIKNVNLGDDKETEQAISLIKDHRVLPIEGADSDAKFLSNPLNQTDIQTLANEYKNLIHYITHIPDLSSVDFSQNASDPIIKIKTKPLLDLCDEKAKWFNKGYIQVLEMTLDFVERNSKVLYGKVKFRIDDIDLVYSHTLPSNDTDMVNMIVNLSNAGLCDPRVLLQSLSCIPNVDEYIKGMKEYNEYVDLRKKSKENNNKGTNETNLERQNATPQTRNQEDNLKNATLGQSQNISDNKVE